MEGLHEMEEELEVELDAYKDFDELKRSNGADKVDFCHLKSP